MRKFIVALFLVLPAAAAMPSAAADSQLWTAGGVDIDVSKRLKLGASQAFRFDNDVSRLKSAFLQGSGRFELHRFARVGGGFRYYMDKGGDSAQRLYLNLRLRYRKKKSPLKYGFRSQWQTTTRVNDTSVDYWRNRVSASYAVNKDVAPFVGFELFYRLDKSEFRRYRFIAGIEIDVAKRWTLEAGYVYQAEINRRNPQRAHILRAELSYHFGKAAGKNKEGAKNE